MPSLKIATWNMEGSKRDDIGPWDNTLCRDLLRESECDVVCLQESGEPPLSAKTEAPIWAGPTPPAVGKNGNPQCLLWNKGTKSRPELYHVYWIHSESDNPRTTGRVNLAIVSKDKPDYWLYVPPLTSSSTGWVGRAGVGFYFKSKNVCVFSIHGNSKNHGADVSYLLNKANEVVETYVDKRCQWFVGGDFNHQPGEAKNPPAYAHLHPPDFETHNARKWPPVKKLDYGWATFAPGRDVEGDVQLDYRESDHLPVIFDQLSW